MQHGAESASDTIAAVLHFYAAIFVDVTLLKVLSPDSGRASDKTFSSKVSQASQVHGQKSKFLGEW